MTVNTSVSLQATTPETIEVVHCHFCGKDISGNLIQYTFPESSDTYCYECYNYFKLQEQIDTHYNHPLPPSEEENSVSDMSVSDYDDDEGSQEDNSYFSDDGTEWEDRFKSFQV